MKNSERKNGKAVVIFIAAINIIGWLAWLIERSGNAAGVGLLLWVASPLIVSVVLRLVFRSWKDAGLKFNFRKNLKWYLLSILFFPAAILLVLTAGRLCGLTDTSNFSIETFFGVLLSTAVFTIVKNFFEEFAWRGFLTSKLAGMKINRLGVHLVTGLIWGSWHLPYYLGLLDKAVFNQYTSINIAVFIILTVISMMIASILFGELRLVTGSIWPPVILHTVSNLLITTLLTEGLIGFKGPGELLFSPGWHSIAMMLILLTGGIAVFHRAAVR